MKNEGTASNQIEKIASKQKEISKNQTAYIPHFKTYLDNLPKLLTNPIRKSPFRNLIMEQTDQVLFTTEIGGSEKFLVGIARKPEQPDYSTEHCSTQPRNRMGTY